MNPNKEMAQRYWSDPDYYVTEWRQNNAGTWWIAKDPSFIDSGEWRVSLATVEGKHVFEGDVGYSKENGKGVTADRYVSRRILEHDFTWNPPKRTVIVNGTELPLPDGDPVKNRYCIYAGNLSSREDAAKWQNKIHELLRGEE